MSPGGVSFSPELYASDSGLPEGGILGLDN